MIRPFQRNFAHVLVLSILLIQSFVSHCCPEYVKNAASNAVANDYAIEDRNGKLDQSIERIFRRSSEQRSDVASSKRDVGSETVGKTVQHDDDANKRFARMKRDSAVKRQSGSTRSSNEKRSISDKRDESSSSRIGRYTKDLPKLPDRDYGLDQERSEYTDEAEDDSASRNKETRYKSNDLCMNEDSAGFIDQQDRSNLYDDFESKDVVKRGVSGAEDYEEVDDDAVGAAEDTAALRGNPLIQDEETEKREVHSDVRVKREHENSKGESENPEGKSVDPGASGDSSSDGRTAETSSKRDDKAADATANRAGKDSIDDQSKKDVAEKGENRDQGSNIEKLIGETVKIQNEQRLNSGIARTDARTGNQDTDILSGKAAGSKVADVANPEAAKVANAASGEEPARLENSRNADEDYQRRVEEQIQRKIDSIKEQIKREIEESQRLREIEENNARFDELRELDEDEQQASLNGEDASKDASDKSQTSDNTAKRSTKRSKRQDNAVQQVSEISSKKSRRGTTSMRKRSSRGADEVQRKRARQAFLVSTDLRKKRRRRRSRSSEQMIIPVQRNVKLEHSLPADHSLDSNLRKALAAGKWNDEDEKAEEDSSSGKKSGSVTLLRESNEKLGPMATEYGEAFGGLNGDPGMELARFKRIKRVLRSSTSKT